MSRFRRVPDEQAGPSALGILVPPGKRTLVVVRPRALAWDLVLLRPPEGNGPAPAFREVGRDEGVRLGLHLYAALEAWAAAGAGRVDVLPWPLAEGPGVRAEVEEMALLACPRAPGQPYRPAVFATLDAARDAAGAILAVLYPAAGREQEIYFNTRNFGR